MKNTYCGIIFILTVCLPVKSLIAQDFVKNDIQISAGIGAVPVTLGRGAEFGSGYSPTFAVNVLRCYKDSVSSWIDESTYLSFALGIYAAHRESGDYRWIRGRRYIDHNILALQWSGHYDSNEFINHGLIEIYFVLRAGMNYKRFDENHNYPAVITSGSEVIFFGGGSLGLKMFFHEHYGIFIENGIDAGLFQFGLSYLI